MKEYEVDNPTLNYESVRQDEQNDLYQASLITALRNGYIVAVDEDEALENTYRALCKKEGRIFIAVDDTQISKQKCIAVEFAAPEQVDQLVAVVRGAGAEIVEVDGLGGLLVVSASEMTVENVARRLALAVKAPVSGEPAESGIVASVDNAQLTQRQLNALARAYTKGYLILDPCFDGRPPLLSLYSAAMEERDRPSVLIMPQWGKRRTIAVLSPNREAILRAAQSAREAGAEVVVDAEAIGLMSAVCENEQAEAVSQAICQGWYAYEREPWPRPQTAIEKQVLELAAGKQG